MNTITLSRADKLVIIFSLALVISLYWLLWRGSSEAQEVEIIVNGEKQYILDLHTNTQIQVDGKHGSSMIEIKDGQARFVSSPCSTSFCVRSGWQHQSGDFVACLPNGVSLHLAGGAKVYDAINF